MPLLLLLACTGGTPEAPKAEAPKAPEVPKPTITPQPFKAPDIPGFTFPVGQSTIDAWTQTWGGEGQISIQSHTWGLFTGLVQQTDQRWGGQPLRVFETWQTPDDLACASADPTQCPTTPRPLTSPGQLTNQPAALAVTVGYEPSLASYVQANQLIDATTLNGLQGQGEAIGRVTLPETSIATKPTYVVVSPGAPAALKVWPGPPDTPRAWGSDQWPECVWIDTGDANPRQGPFATTTTCEGAPPEGLALVPLGAFIHFSLDAAGAKQASAALKRSVQEGDIAVLVGMHVTSRESSDPVARWTWQTFWWSDDAASPHAPSSAPMAALRPAALLADVPASNYAGCSAWQMLDPVQPLTGGGDAGAPVLCYNPWLEAGFAPDPDLPFETGQGWTWQGQTYDPQYGVQTNCMSCHLQAAWKGQPFAQSVPAAGTTPPLCEGTGCYTAARYIDTDASYFQGAVTVDTLWSIADSVPASAAPASAPAN